MTQIKTNFEPDLLGAAIPGQSLTANPGQFPYEKPPLVSNPRQALKALVNSISTEKASKEISSLLDAGITVETLASAFVVGGVSEGLFNPDVAEMIKPLLVGYITKIGDDKGVEDFDVLNKFPDKEMSEQDSIELMSKISPSKFEKLKNDMNNREIDTERNFEEEQEMIDSSPSFLDMRSDV